MDVAIEHHGSHDVSVTLKAANRDGDIVDDAEALTVIGKGVVKTASDVNAAVVAQSLLGSHDGAAGHVPEGLDELLAVGNLEFELLAGTEGSGFEFLYPEAGVDQQYIFIAAKRRREDVGFGVCAKLY
jgi:hypothetical protein